MTRFSVFVIFVLSFIVCIESSISVIGTTYETVQYEKGENYYLTGFCLLMPSIPISGEYEAYVKYEFEEKVRGISTLYPFNDGDQNIDMENEFKIDEQDGSKNLVVYKLHTIEGEELNNWDSRYYEDFAFFNGLVVSESPLRSVTFEVRGEFFKDVNTEGEECIVPDSHFYKDHSLGFINFGDSSSSEEEQIDYMIYHDIETVEGMNSSSDNPTNDIYYYTTGYNIFMVICLISSMMLCCITLASIRSRIKRKNAQPKYDSSPVQNFEYFYDHPEFPTVNLQQQQGQELYLIQPFSTQSGNDSSNLTFEAVFIPEQQQQQQQQQTLYPQL